MTTTTTTARRTARHLRLWLGVGVAVGVLFMPGLSRAEGFTLSAAALTYVLGATLFDAIAARRSGFPARVLTPLLGLAAIELVIIVIPRALGAGLVLFLLVVTFSAYVGGLRLGLWLSAAAVPGAALANAIAPEADRIDGGTVVAFAVLVPVLALLTGRLTAERRRTAIALPESCTIGAFNGISIGGVHECFMTTARHIQIIHWDDSADCYGNSG